MRTIHFLYIPGLTLLSSCASFEDWLESPDGPSQVIGQIPDALASGNWSTIVLGAAGSLLTLALGALGVKRIRVRLSERNAVETPSDASEGVPE